MIILLVDDKPENLYLLEKFFQGNGHSTFSAANGAEALAYALKSPPDIIISDVLMPVMDGFTLCREWRKNELLQTIPFVFYTATYTDPKDEEFALNLGADRFIVKPQDLSTLYKNILEQYNSSRMKTTRPLPPAPEAEEKVFLKEYNETLVRKLEKKMTQIDAAEKELREKNAALEKEIEHYKRTEEVLQKSEKRLREAQEMAHLGFWDWDVKTGEVQWSEEVFKIFGLDPKTFTPHIDSILALSPWPEDHQRDQELIDRAIQTHSPGSYEQKFLRPDQSIGQYYSTFQGNYSENGELISIVGTVLDITERKRSEEALKDNEQRFRSIVENSEAGYFFIDKDGIIQDVNTAWVKLYRYNSAAEILGQHFAVIQKIDDLSQAKEFVDGILRNDSRYLNGDFSRQCNDGTIGYHSFSARPVFRGGQTIGIEGFIIDATESHRASEKLEESKQRFQSLFDNMVEGVALHSLVFDDTGVPINYRIIEINNQFGRILDVSRADIVGKLATEAYGVIDPPYGAEYFRVALHHEPYLFEAYFAPMQKHFLISSVPWGTNGFATIFQDITERKRAEEALKQSERRLTSIYETVDDIIIHLEVEAEGTYRFISVNRAFCKITGLREELVIGKLVNEVIPEPSLSYVLGKYRQAIEENSIVHWEETSDYPTGRLIGDVSIAPVLNEKGQCTHLVGSVHDITERKRTEERQTSLNRIFEESLNEIYIFSVDDYKFLEANKGARINIGYTIEELRTMTPLDIKPEFTKQSFSALISPLLTGEQDIVIFETIHRRKNGSDYRVEVHLQCSTFEAKPVFVALILDITERVQIEEKNFQQLEELRRWQGVTLGREDRIRQLKSEVNELLIRLGETLRYPSQENNDCNLPKVTGFEL